MEGVEWGAIQVLGKVIPAFRPHGVLEEPRKRRKREEGREGMCDVSGYP